jgi:hypothetical protein
MARAPRFRLQHPSGVANCEDSGSFTITIRMISSPQMLNHFACWYRDAGENRTDLVGILVMSSARTPCDIPRGWIYFRLP